MRWGKVKFMFPNQYNIYLHDTPSKSLFANEVRAYSHGCIRRGRPVRPRPCAVVAAVRRCRGRIRQPTCRAGNETHGQAGGAGAGASGLFHRLSRRRRAASAIAAMSMAATPRCSRRCSAAGVALARRSGLRPRPDTDRRTAWRIRIARNRRSARGRGRGRSGPDGHRCVRAAGGRSGPDLALAMDPRYGDGIGKGQARAAMVWPGADWRAMGLKAAIFAPRGRLAMAGLTAADGPRPGDRARRASDGGGGPFGQASATAPRIGPFVTIGAGVRDRAGRADRQPRLDCRRRADRRRCADPSGRADRRAGHHRRPVHLPARRGDRRRRLFLRHAREIRRRGNSRNPWLSAPKSRDQSWTRIHSLGAVTIGDDVEIGANACIDRGTIRDTVIGRGHQAG